MLIKISQNLIKSISEEKERKYKTLSDIQIAILEGLREDKVIKNTNNITFKVITNQFQGIHIVDMNIVVFYPMHIPGLHNTKPDGRNTFIAQGYFPAKNYAKNNNCSLVMSLRPSDFKKMVHYQPFVKFDIDICMALGINICNSLLKSFTPNKLENLHSLLKRRNDLSSRNKGNQPSYICVNDENKIVHLMGKLDGANGGDTVLLCEILSKMCKNEKYKLFFSDITPVDKKTSNSNILLFIQNVLEHVNIVSQTPTNEIKNIIDNIEINEISDEQLPTNLIRDQLLFRENIVKRYNKFFNCDICFACDYFISGNLIASHIYRYADIVRDYKNGKLSIEKAHELIVSGENGFLLCRNHDGEFEKGQLFFDLNLCKFNYNKKLLSNEEIQGRIEQTPLHQNAFPNELITPQFKENVSKHIQRIS